MRVRLHTKFIVLLTSVSLVPLVIVSGFTLLRFQRSLETEAAKLGHQVAATAAAEIRTFMISQLVILDNIATIYHPEFPIEKDVAERISDSILFRSENFMDISVVDKSGREILRKNRLLVIRSEDLRDRADSPEYTTVKEHGVYVGPVYVRSGKSFFDFGRHILDSRGEFAGAVFAQVDARVMPSVVERISEIIGSSGRVYIVNERGIVIAHPDLSYVLAERDLSALPPIQDIVSDAQHTSRSAIYDNEIGERVLGSAHPMTIELFDVRSQMPPSINWFVVAEQQESTVYGEALSAARFSIVLSLLAVVAAILAAVYFAGRISRPIEALHTAALEFGKGNLAYRARVETSDEIGDLARSFNTTASELAKTVESLKSEEQITAAERNKLRVILSGITNAVIAVDRERKIILFNRAAEALTATKTDAVIGLPVGEVIRILDGEREVAIDTYCPAGPEDTEGPVFSKNDLKLITSHGDERFINLVAGRIREGASINLGCVLTFQDITREYVMERTKREFVSIAAHQLRTPLTGMTWTVEYLLSEAKGKLNDAQKTIVNQAMDATKRMIELVNDLLDVSRIEEGRFGVKPKKQSVAVVITRVTEAMQKQAVHKGVELRLDVPAALPEADIDASKMAFALGNIVDNALKYTPRGGDVVVKAAREGDSVLITVADTGIGIPANEFDRVFTKFFRSRKALLYHTDGSGLGLYVAKNIVEQHGGKMWFTSVENKGTTFFVSFPIVSKLPSDNQPSAPAIALQHA